MSTLIERVEARINEIAARDAEIRTELEELANDPEARGLDTEGALARVGELRGEAEQLREEHGNLEARLQELRDEQERRSLAGASRPESVAGHVVKVTNEERTYHRGNARQVSFIADAFNAQNGDWRAQERIQRHMREAEVEHRDLTSGSFNGLIPPQYLLEDFAPLARAGRPFANAVPTRPLPATGMTLISTKTVTGTATAVQTAENAGATETDLVTTDITIPVVSILGQQDLSRQSIERGSRSDTEVFADLLADYHTKLDRAWLTGSGASGEPLGILNAATQVQTWTGTTVASFISKVIGAAAQVAGGIFRPATCVVMTSRRWHWLLAASDSTGRPIVTTAGANPQNAVGVGGTGYAAVGTLVGPGLPVIVDDNIGTTHGASTNEDRVIVTRLEELRGWEDGVMSFRFEQPAGPQTIRLAVMGYSAFNAERYVAGTAIVVGTGLVAPTF